MQYFARNFVFFLHAVSDGFLLIYVMSVVAVKILEKMLVMWLFWGACLSVLCSRFGLKGDRGGY